MKLTAVLLTTAVLLAAPENVVQPESAPTTIGIYTNYSHGGFDRDAPEKYIVMPVAAYQDGRWFPSAFFALASPEEPYKWVWTFRPEQEAFLDALMTQTFYLCKNPATTFSPEKKKIQWIWEQQYTGLAGTLKGKIEEEDEFFDLAMTNVPEVSAALKTSALSEENASLFSKQVKELICKKVTPRESQGPTDSQRPTFKPERYQLPEYVEVLEIKLASGWEGLWVHLNLDYPMEESPQMEYSERSMWSGYYYAIAEVRPESKTQILWEYNGLFEDDMDRRYYLKGVFDADEDNKPEFLFDVGRLEYREYMLVHAENGELVKISSELGSL